MGKGAAAQASVSVTPAPFSEYNAHASAIPPSTASSSAASSALSSTSPFSYAGPQFTDEELLTIRTVVLSGTDVEAKREELRRYFHATFTISERLFREVLLTDQTYYLQPDKLRHPLIFYHAHPAVFFINKLVLSKVIPNSARINPHFEAVFAVGVDEMSWDDLNPASYNWPAISIESIRQYRNQVRSIVDQVITNMKLELPINWQSPAWIILMGIEHERIHLETSSVLFRQLPMDQVRTDSQFWKICEKARADRPAVPKNTLLPVPEGRVDIGKPFDHNLYGWDVEYGQHIRDVKAFQATQFLVSNAEYYEFMQDGGYEEPAYWGAEGWKFLEFRKLKAPVFWEARPTKSTNTAAVEYYYRAMNQLIPMPWDWPVDVNYLEAAAFCRWKAKKTGLNIRLPTEEEWSRLRDYTYPERSNTNETVNVKGFDSTLADQPYWSSAPGNLNLEHYAASSCPIDEFSFDHGFFDIIGNVWQHTCTPVNSFSGFKYHPAYDDFSVPTFDSRHNLIKGGSFISTGNEATRLARYAFRRHFYQHAGFRYVAVQDSEKDKSLEAESTQQQISLVHDHTVTPIIHSQYQMPEFLNRIQKENHSVLIARAAVEAFKAANPNRDLKSIKAVDLGCGGGRTAFELAAAGIEQVLGLDRTALFIQLCALLGTSGNIQYTLKKYGELENFHEIDVATPPSPTLSSSSSSLSNKHTAFYPAEIRQRCQFIQNDGENLETKYSQFDLLICSFVLEYLSNPQRFLQLIHERLNVNGVLVMVSTYEWDTKYTPERSNWVGGIREAGEGIQPFDAMETILEQHFTLIQRQSTPIYASIERSERDYKIMAGELSIWQRK